MDAALGIPSHVARDHVFDFDIYGDPRIGQDVQGSYARALKDAPDVFYTPRNGGHWMVRRLADIAEVNKDYEHFSVREMQIPRVPDPPFFIPLSLDPPENLPYRQALMPFFSPKAIRELEPKIRHWAERIVDDVAANGGCDFVRDVSSLFPVSIFMELMGMPLERLREFRAKADAFFSAHDPGSLAKMSAEIQAIMQALIDERRVLPQADLISHFLTMDLGGRNPTPEEVLAICFILFLGGMDTVTNVTSFAFQHLAQDPGLQTRLAADPALIPKFVEEALRCFGVINTPRLVVRDCERFGVHFKAGDMVLTLLPMAGRDDRANPAAARFDIDREHPQHLTFSTGPHLCIGHNLARTEIRFLTEEWLRRIPAFSPAPGIRHGFRTGTVMALESLPLSWPG